MKLWVWSDLHLEFETFLRAPTVPEADVCVMAGDLTTGVANSVHWLGKYAAQKMPCVFVAGNHEFYGNSVVEGLEDGRKAAEQFPDVNFLENNSVVLEGVRFVGATLWTDFELDGNRELAMIHARENMNDFRGQIAYMRPPLPERETMFSPELSAEMHARSRHFLVETLAAPFDGKTVVVTHHLPHLKSVAQRFKGDPLNTAFASDLSDVMEQGRPNLWVHGHTHDSCDYSVGDTRVLCNPLGYRGENRSFNPAMIVEV